MKPLWNASKSVMPLLLFELCTFCQLMFLSFYQKKTEHKTDDMWEMCVLVKYIVAKF